MPSASQPSFEDNVKNSFSRVKEHISLLEKELKADRTFLIKQNDQIRFLLGEISRISSERDELKAKLASFKHESSIGNEGVYSFIHSLNIHSTDIHSANRHSDKQIPIVQEPQKEIPKFEDNSLKAEPVIEVLPFEPAPFQEKPVKEKPVFEEPISGEKKEGNPLNIVYHNRNAKPISSNLLQGHSTIIGLKSDILAKFSGLSRQEFLTFLTVYQLEEEIEHVSYIDIAAKLSLTEGCIRTYVSSLVKKCIPLVKAKYNNKVVYVSISKDFRAFNLKRELMALYYKADPTQKTLAEGYH